MLRTLIVVVAITAGCKSGDKAERASTSSAAPSAGSVDALFTGSAVTLPPEVAKATFGGAKADVLAAHGATSGFVPSTAPSTSYNLGFDKMDKLDKLTVSTQTDLEPVLTKQWGPPIKTKKEAFWFSPATGLRAWLPDHGKGKSVTFGPYEPLSKVLGGKGFELAFAAGKPLLGATLDELKAAWGEVLCNFDEEAPRMRKAFEESAQDSIARLQNVPRDLRICHQPLRTVELYSGLGDTVHIGRDARVASVRMSFPTGGAAELQQQIMAELDAKFGTPVVLQEGDKHERSYFDPAARLRAVASFHDQSVGLAVSRYLPLAELLGGDRPGLGIEGPHMPGGTFAQIKADDPEHFHQMGVLASLLYPPTEYNQEHTEVSLDFYDKRANTHGYTVVLHHTDREAVGDEVFELLKQKFGEPKPDKRSTDKDAYWNFARNGRKVSARRVSQQWQLRVTK